MIINTNVLALNSHRAMKNVGNAQASASAKLSSGLRINSAADDAAGLAISEKMRGQIRGLNMASKNAQDGSSLIQTAEGGMQQIGDMVQRIRELTVQAANDTNDQASGDRNKIQLEINDLISEIDSMASRVQFNNKRIIDGSVGTLTFQVGANGGQTVSISISSMKASALGLSSSTINVDVTNASQISPLLSTLDNALKLVNNERAKLGAKQNRLEYTMKSLDISSENLSASESRIRDTDMAKEMMNLTKANVLTSAATSMLSQANQQPQNVLQLLR
ncbi:MAG: flagellin [Clostridiales bacterium]|jgi:flagellin|nr:flagellin [Clostridiales bacterium]